VLRVAFDRQRGAPPFSDRLAAASRHIAIALLSALIVATFSRRVRQCGIGATVATRDRVATQDRVGMIPRDWHRELKMTTLAAAAPVRRRCVQDMCN
jgi:hypothetical protein